MRSAFFLCSLIIVAISSGCNQPDGKTASLVQKVFFDTAGMDTTIKPGDNFFMYANGKWMRGQSIPDDQSGWGSFYELDERNLENLKDILEETSGTSNKKGSLEQKVGDYFQSGMDTIAIEKRSAEPLKPILARIDSVKKLKPVNGTANRFFCKRRGKPDRILCSVR